jgi:hypothetical protein
MEAMEASSLMACLGRPSRPAAMIRRVVSCLIWDSRSCSVLSAALTDTVQLFLCARDRVRGRHLSECILDLFFVQLSDVEKNSDVSVQDSIASNTSISDTQNFKFI